MDKLYIKFIGEQLLDERSRTKFPYIPEYKYPFISKQQYLVHHFITESDYTLLLKNEERQNIGYFQFSKPVQKIFENETRFVSEFAFLRHKNLPGFKFSQNRKNYALYIDPKYDRCGYGSLFIMLGLSMILSLSNGEKSVLVGDAILEDNLLFYDKLGFKIESTENSKVYRVMYKMPEQKIKDIKLKNSKSLVSKIYEMIAA